ncbi:mismatch-specific DNA-glycosylase [Aggregatilinea lenta]|uniref:mismatch-specific DNA-glycosylase n=1 Tax=Aggregatilinea lenta TaxID=913108 RepID=UPI000E5B2CAA|nr:mismatch-specific DNA-glycosylase [Aggregatilinea lenta]
MPVLPDVLAPGLKVVFVGTAASRRAAEVGAPYAGPGNRFWDILYAAGFTPRRLKATEFQTVTQYGLGLTGMAPNAVGNDDVLRPEDFDAAGLRAKIEQFQPRVVAFAGKRAAQEFLGHRIPAYGLQPESVGPTRIWVLPSTSGAARAFWDEAPWRALAAFVADD